MVYIDADGCPVTKAAVEICKQLGQEVTLVFDTSHSFADEYAKTIMVDKGSDSADMKIASLARKGDVIVTQDYGLAAMCLSKNCICISQDGMIYDNSNIDSLLFSRYMAKKIRNSGGKLKGPHKRNNEQNKHFQDAFTKILNEKR